MTLASSGSEGGPNMGAMRQAQTASYGILPNAAMPNTFLAQAYDLDDEWGPAAGPCVTSEWACCPFACGGCAKYNKTSCDAGTKGKPAMCEPACDAALDTTFRMGGIHPRSKIQVGERLATAYYNTLAGGKSAYTGPTLAGCTATAETLHITFNTSLLRGDTLTINAWGEPYTPPVRHASSMGGSYLYVQTNASLFCMEPAGVVNASGATVPGMIQCPTWAGGDGVAQSAAADPLDGQWTLLNFTADAAGTGVVVDLAPLNGSAPTAVRYAWGIVQCCNDADPTLYVSHGCIASCPIYSKQAQLPANPFKAKIVGGKCECVAPQRCS